MTLAMKILAELDRQNGRSDSQLSLAIFCTRHRRNQINSECRHMENCGLLIRRKNYGTPILNYKLTLKPRLSLI